MGITDIMMGKTKLETLGDFKDLVDKKVKKYKKEKDPKKKEKVEKKLRNKMWKFFKELNKMGVEVYLEKPDGEEMISEYDVKERIDVGRLFSVYVTGTIKAINKKVEEKK